MAGTLQTYKTTTLNELVYGLIELYRANYKVTDSLDERLVMLWIQKTRALLLKQTSEGIKYIDPHVTQTLENVELELVSTITVPNMANGGRILRTKLELPAFIDTKEHKPMITRIYGANLIDYEIELVSVGASPFVGSGKFNTNTIYAFLYDKRLYFTSKSGIHFGINYVNITGVFANPIAAYEFMNGPNSYNWDYEYPISESIVSQLEELITKTKFNFVLYPLQDPVNNATDDITNKPVR